MTPMAQMNAGMGRGFFAIGIWHPKTEVNVGTLWRTAHIFGAAFVFTVGRRYKRQASDTLNTPNHVPLMHFKDIEDLAEHLPHSCRLIGVELTERATPSHVFNHDQRACYLLGAEDNGLSPAVLESCHDVLKLPGRSSLNVAVAGSLVVYDRWRQANEREAWDRTTTLPRTIKELERWNSTSAEP